MKFLDNIFAELKDKIAPKLEANLLQEISKFFAEPKTKTIETDSDSERIAKRIRNGKLVCFGFVSWNKWRKKNWLDLSKKQSEILKVNTKKFIFWETKKSIKSLILNKEEVFNLTLFSFENKNKRKLELWKQNFIIKSLLSQKEMNLLEMMELSKLEKKDGKKSFGRNYWKIRIWKGYKSGKSKL